MSFQSQLRAYICAAEFFNAMLSLVFSEQSLMDLDLRNVGGRIPCIPSPAQHVELDSLGKVNENEDRDCL